MGSTKLIKLDAASVKGVAEVSLKRVKRSVKFHGEETLGKNMENSSTCYLSGGGQCGPQDQKQ